MKLHILTCCLLFSVLAGCQSTANYYETPYDNPRVYPPPGTLLELHTDLPFAVNNSRSTIQYGKKIGQGRFSRFDPWCQFYLYESQEEMKQVRTIEPDTFTVTKSFQSIDWVLLKPLQVAYGSISVGGGPMLFGRYDEMGSRTMRTTLRLQSDKQPQVYELRCGKDDDAYLQNYVTINEMIKTLGDIATLKLPAAEPPAQ